MLVDQFPVRISYSNDGKIGLPKLDASPYKLTYDMLVECDTMIICVTLGTGFGDLLTNIWHRSWKIETQWRGYTAVKLFKDCDKGPRIQLVKLA